MLFSPEECRRRIDAVRSLLNNQDLDAALLHSPDNQYYFSGFRSMLHTRFTAVVVIADDAVLVVPTIDEKLAKEDLWSHMWLDDIALWGPEDRADIYPSHVAALEHLLEGPARVGVDELTLAEYNELSSSLDDIEFVDLHHDITSIRAVKSTAERQLIERAQQLAIAGLTQLADQFADFKTERDIKVFLDDFAAEHQSDGYGYPTLVSCGGKIDAPHSPALDRPLVEGELIRVAFGPTFSGYTADIVRTFIVGKPTDFYRLCESAYFKATDAVLERLRPGVSCRELVEAVRDVYKDEGVSQYWGNNVGHGLGLSIHETPRIAGKAPDIIKEGMVLAIEPNPKGGARGGFYHCNVYHVSATGPELLSPGLNRFVVI